MSASEHIAKQRRAFFPGKLSCIQGDFSGNIIWTLDIARGRDRGGGFGGESAKITGGGRRRRRRRRSNISNISLGCEECNVFLWSGIGGESAFC